jgi:polygalacturonase
VHNFDLRLYVSDDCIAIKSGMNEPGIKYGWPSVNITIQNCIFRNGHGLSIGSEMSGGTSYVLSNVNFRVINLNTCVLIPFHTGVKNVLFANCTASGLKS